MQSLCSVTRERSARGTPQLALTECGPFVALTIVQSNTCTRQRVRAKIASSKFQTFSEPTLTTTQLSESSAGVAHASFLCKSEPPKLMRSHALTCGTRLYGPTCSAWTSVQSSELHTEDTSASEKLVCQRCNSSAVG